MRKQTYRGKYCAKRARSRRMCTVLYVINFLLLAIAAVRIVTASGEFRDQDSVFMAAGATTMEHIPAAATQPPDTQPPEILGVEDILAYEGETVSYRSGVTVTDDTDEEPELTVDSRQVNLTRAGSYSVTYHAADAAGNRTSVSANVTILPREEGFVDLETIYASADATLGVIITEEMDTKEQVHAIYNWSRNTCRYSGHSDRTDWRQTAYTMLTTGTGDCFGFYSVTKLLFERLGIPNIDVVKVKNHDTDSEHFWSLVSVDGGETYYHFDATPRMGQVTQLCLVTDSLLDSFSQRNSGSHNRDTSLYPATPEV